jgi:hypothetical protein
MRKISIILMIAGAGLIILSYLFRIFDQPGTTLLIFIGIILFVPSLIYLILKYNRD